MKLHPDKNLDRQLKAAIKAAAENPEGFVRLPPEEDGYVQRLIRRFMEDLDVVGPNSNAMRLQGYWLARRMNKPAWWLWCKDNWFPTMIAVILAVSAVADILLRIFAK